jgi:5-methylcytosine-specific restriction endonuclease McrA
MRLIREMPETGEQLVAGSLTLETMSTLSNHIRRTKPSKEARTQLVASAQHLSKRELERKLGKPEMTAVYLKPDLIKKLEDLKIVFGMTSLERILNQLADQALARARVKEKKRLEKLEREKLSSRRADPGRSQTETEVQFTPPAEQQPARQFTPPAEQQLARQSTPPAEQQLARQSTPPAEQQLARRFTPPAEQPKPIVTPNREPADIATSNPTAPATDSVTTTDAGTAIRSRYVPKPMRGHLIRRDQARCAYVDPLTKRQCSETRHLEFDHVQPFARGGQTTEANLRVLCANHNRFRARRMGFSPYRR